jgi:hypothetical protein
MAVNTLRWNDNISYTRINTLKLSIEEIKKITEFADKLISWDINLTNAALELWNNPLNQTIWKEILKKNPIIWDSLSKISNYLENKILEFKKWFDSKNNPYGNITNQSELMLIWLSAWIAWILISPIFDYNMLSRFTSTSVLWLLWYTYDTHNTWKKVLSKEQRKIDMWIDNEKDHPKYKEFNTWLDLDWNREWYEKNKWLIKLVNWWLYINWDIFYLEDEKSEDSEWIFNIDWNTYFEKESVYDYLKTHWKEIPENWWKYIKMLPWNSNNKIFFLKNVLWLQLWWSYTRNLLTSELHPKPYIKERNNTSDINPARYWWWNIEEWEYLYFSDATKYINTDNTKIWDSLMNLRCIRKYK